MAEKLDPKETVSFEELLMSNVYTQEALINLLEATGIIKKAEILEEIKKIRAKQTSLSPPSNIDLPFFVYGNLKPGELAFSQIEPFIPSGTPPVAAVIRGSLFVRDGLPLLDPDGCEQIKGFILRFSPAESATAYKLICSFEPKAHYFWKEIVLESPLVRANVLLGKKLSFGRPQKFDGNDWSFRLDPVFSHALDIIDENIKLFATDLFKIPAKDLFDWPRFFRLQMTYLLLWSCIERYTTLAYGPGLAPEERNRRLGEDKKFGRSLPRCEVRSNVFVSDARHPEKKIYLNPDNPISSAKYYYQVRSNLSHRGKAAWADGEIVTASLRELFKIFKDMLKQIPGDST